MTSLRLNDHQRQNNTWRQTRFCLRFCHIRRSARPCVARARAALMQMKRFFIVTGPG